MLHVTVCSPMPHVTPPCAGHTTVVRERELWPAWHVEEHADHADQGLCTQSTGQSVILHAAVSSNAAQGLPPKLAARTTERDRCLAPPSHVTEHALQAVKCESTQSTGHGSTRQGSLITSVGQGVPPNFASTLTLRKRSRLPPPHVTVQAPQRPKSVTSQAIGQPLVLQTCSSRIAGHFFPPYCAGRARVRVRVFEPEPHDASQSLHQLKAEVKQSMGHACSSHARDSASDGQDEPPWAARATMLRARCCKPPPHDVEQCVHAPKVDTRQCKGQRPSLHEARSNRLAQRLPP